MAVKFEDIREKFERDIKRDWFFLKLSNSDDWVEYILYHIQKYLFVDEKRKQENKNKKTKKKKSVNKVKKKK